MLFVNYHTDIRVERLEKSMNKCGVSGLFLTECLSIDTFKTEYATRQLGIGKGVQESSCGVFLRYCCSICLERREHQENA
jgi:hypothetical protein